MARRTVKQFEQDFKRQLQQAEAKVAEKRAVLEEAERSLDALRTVYETLTGLPAPKDIDAEAGGPPATA